MTNEEKAVKVAELLRPEVVETASLLPFIEIAKTIVLNRLYPYSDVDGMDVPSRYDYIHCMITVDLWNKRGAEGQTSHTENGISRVWADSLVSPSLLKMIPPMVGSVVNNANARKE